MKESNNMYRNRIQASKKKRWNGEKELFLHTCKGSHRMCSIKNTALKNFAIFTRKHVLEYLFHNAVEDCHWRRSVVFIVNFKRENNSCVVVSDLKLETDLTKTCFFNL